MSLVHWKKAEDVAKLPEPSCCVGFGPAVARYTLGPALLMKRGGFGRVPSKAAGRKGSRRAWKRDKAMKVIGKVDAVSLRLPPEFFAS